MTIEQLAINVFPVTDAKLADTEHGVSGYAAIRTGAVDRAKRDLYGVGVTVPAEADIPDVAQYWIADKAVLYLIPVAIDFYMQTRISDSKENANISYYDKVQALRDLEAELKVNVARTLGDAQDAIDSGNAPEAIDSAPDVSVDGLLLDPTSRAWYRGPF